MFNFTIISNSVAGQHIHLKSVFVPGRASGLFIKWLFLGQHVGPDCQLVSISKVPLNSEDSSALFQLLTWPFFGFLILQNERHIQSNVTCVQNLWVDSSNRFIVLVRRWDVGGHVFELCLQLWEKIPKKLRDFLKWGRKQKAKSKRYFWPKLWKNFKNFESIKDCKTFSQFTFYSLTKYRRNTILRCQS